MTGAVRQRQAPRGEPAQAGVRAQAAGPSRSSRPRPRPRARTGARSAAPPARASAAARRAPRERSRAAGVAGLASGGRALMRTAGGLGAPSSIRERRATGGRFGSLPVGGSDRDLRDVHAMRLADEVAPHRFVDVPPAAAPGRTPRAPARRPEQAAAMRAGGLRRADRRRRRDRHVRRLRGTAGISHTSGADRIRHDGRNRRHAAAPGPPPRRRPAPPREQRPPAAAAARRPPRAVGGSTAAARRSGAPARLGVRRSAGAAYRASAALAGDQPLERARRGAQPDRDAGRAIRSRRAHRRRGAAVRRRRQAAAGGRGARDPARRPAARRSGGRARPPQRSARAETALSSPQATILEPGQVDLEGGGAGRARDRADHLLARVDPFVEALQVVEVDRVQVLDQVRRDCSCSVAQPRRRSGRAAAR